MLFYMANEFFNGSDFSQVGLYRGYKWKKKFEYLKDSQEF